MTELETEILQAESNGLLAVTTRTRTSIETDDFELDKPIAYRLVPPDPAWYASRIKFVSDAAKKSASHLENQLVDLLMSLDPDMTRMLSAIYVVAEPEDADRACALTDADPCEFPDCVDLEDNEGVLGCLWWSQCSIILDANAISHTAKDVVDDALADGYTLDEATEFDTGVYTTLTHEIYHLAAADPFMELEDGEGAAERYGIEAYEDWKYHRK